jgi:hypothetical protein
MNGCFFLLISSPCLMVKYYTIVVDVDKDVYCGREPIYIVSIPPCRKQVGR